MLPSNPKVHEFVSFIQSRCPRCRNGKIFKNSIYGMQLQKMNESCPVCQLKFEREPGYFYVAMFISYALNVAVLVCAAVACYLLGLALSYENLWYYTALLFTSVILVAPINYRYSRVILLYWLTPGTHYMGDNFV